MKKKPKKKVWAFDYFTEAGYVRVYFKLTHCKTKEDAKKVFDLIVFTHVQQALGVVI